MGGVWLCFFVYHPRAPLAEMLRLIPLGQVYLEERSNLVFEDKMTERDQEALDKGFKSLGDNIDKLYSRPLQKTAYLCMAKCNDSSTLSTEAVSACMRRCEQPLHEVNQVVQQEVGGLQNRIQRCIMDCTDEARDLIPPGAKEGDAVVQRAMDQNIKCTGGCVKKHLGLLPGIEAKIKAAAARAAKVV